MRPLTYQEDQDIPSPDLFEASDDDMERDNYSHLDGSSVEQILSAIRGLSKCEQNEDPASSDETELDDRLLQRVCSRVGLLTPTEFSDLEDQLFTYLLEEWPSNSCYRTLEFVVDIFCYICTVVSQVKIVQDYLFYFSQPSMPAHIRLLLYPALVLIANKRFPNRFEQEVLNGETLIALIERRSNFQEIDASKVSEFMTFWKSIFRFYLSTESPVFESKILTGFVCSHFQFSAVCADDEHRTTMLKVFGKCLVDKPNRTTLLLASLFIVFVRSMKFTPKSWAGMKFLVSKLTTATSHFRYDDVITNFISSVISSFIQSASVENEKLIQELLALPLIRVKTNDRVNHNVKTEVGLFQNNDNIKNNVGRSECERNTNNCSQNSNSSGSGSSGNNSQKTNKERFEIPHKSNGTQLASNATTNLNSIKNGNANIPTSEKTLDLLEKLVNKMKATKVKLCLESDKDKLRSLISELNAFL